MDPQGSKQGFNLGMVRSPSTIPTLPSELLTPTRGVYYSASTSRSYRGGNISPLSGSPIFSSKEEYRQKTGHPRPVNSQSLHSLSNLQDDHPQGSSIDVAGRGLRNVDRPERCLLAYPDPSLLLPLSRLCHRRQEISIQGAAFWPEYCTQNLHKDVQAHLERAKNQGYTGTRLHRRLAHMGLLQGRISEEHRDSDRSPPKERISDKFSEVSFDSDSENRMVGDPLGLRVRPSLPASGQGRHLDEGHPKVLEKTVCLEEGNREDAGKTPVCLPCRPSREVYPKESQRLSSESSSPRTTRSKMSFSSPTKEIPQSLAFSTCANSQSSLPSTPSFHGHLHGRLTYRLGSAHLGGHALKGTWSGPLAKCHINILELATVFIALKRLQIKPSRHVRVHSDNSTVVACLNRGGSSRSKPLNSWTTSIMSLLSARRIHVSAFHLAGIRNVVADVLSRGSPISSEWSLSKKNFQFVSNLLGPFQIDLFATRGNSKLEKFISPMPDPQAQGVDAFSLDWNTWRCIYLYPPVKILPRVLSYLESFRGKGALITPLWPTQSWFLTLQARYQSFVEIPNPCLSQKIGQEIFYCSSSSLLHLVCWSL